MMDLKRISKTKEDLDAYEVQHLFHSWSYQPAQSPLRVVGAKGVRFTTEDGRERLDFSSCFVSHNIGHQDPRVVEAIREQAGILCSFAPVLSTEPRALLAKTLATVTPGDLSRTFLTLGGAEANEAAIKICHQYTGRRKILARYRAYHGGHDPLAGGCPQLGASSGRDRSGSRSPALLLPLHVRARVPRV